MDKTTGLFLMAGIFAGIVSTLVFFKPLIRGYQIAIQQCEAELPRSQHCVITAIPEMNDGQR